MNFVFGTKSEAKLVGVHPHLIAVVRRALEVCEYDFSVIEGTRTVEKQAEYLAAGKSWTMKSRHIPTPTSFGTVGHAVDLYPVGKPTPWDRCHNIAAAMFQASKELGFPIRWGGDWDMDGDSKDEKSYDGPHFELLRSAYP